MSRPNTVEKFWSLVDQSDQEGCWPWTRSVRDDGYGQFKFEGRNWGTHRLAYILTRGEVPEGLVLDHLCRVRHCCNPDHLEPVTNAENVLRGEGVTAQLARATHCVNGHPFSGRSGRRGQRICVTCRRANQRKLKQLRAKRIAKDPSLAQHGLVLTYSAWGCRCVECKAAWSMYMAEYHQRRRAA